MKRLLLLVLSCIPLLSYAYPPPADLVTYPAPAGLTPASDFRLWVNEQEIFLYQTEPAAVGIFSFRGNVTIRIQPTQDVKWVDVRPKNLGVAPELKQNRISFSLNQPAALSIEFHNEIKRVIHLFANPLEQSPPSPRDPHVKYFRAGQVYEAGSIELKDEDHLYIEGGAVLKGSVKAENARRVRISGRGIIDGGQLPKSTRMILLDHVEGATIEGVTLLNSHTWTVEPMFCRNLRIDNLKIVNWDFGSDGIDLVGTSDVKIENCFIRANDDCIVVKTWGGSEKYPQQPVDGPDVRNIQVLNSVFWNMPWGNALEIGFELRARNIEDILFKNCDIIHVERGAALSIHNGDYATIRNIRYEDIRVEDARHKLIDLAVFLSQYSVDRPEDAEARKQRYKQGAWDGVLWVYPGEETRYAAKRGCIRDITFKNIRVLDGPVPFSVISGYDAQHPVENVTIEDLYVHGRKITSAQEAKLFTENAKNVQIR